MKRHSLPLALPLADENAPTKSSISSSKGDTGLNDMDDTYVEVMVNIIPYVNNTNRKSVEPRLHCVRFVLK